MSTTAPNEAAAARPWENQPQPQPQAYPPAPSQPGAYPPPYAGPSPQQPAAQRPPAAPGGNLLRRWPTWAQNTALIVGAVAVLVVVFFAGFFTGHASNDQQGGFGTNQNLDPRQFGGNGGDGFGQPGAGS